MIINISERQKYAIWRKIHKITLYEISQIIGICESEISRWENGKRDLPYNMIRKYNEFIRKFEERVLYAENQKF